MEHENNIVYDSYYLINLFKSDGNKMVTQLQVQKLMYFFEAYYMNELSLREIAENDNVSRNAVHNQ